MKRIILVAAIALTAILYAMGYAVEFVITALAMSLDLPGPYSDSPVVWVWFAVSLVTVFGVSLGFCRWFARRIEKKVVSESTFE